MSRPLPPNDPARQLLRYNKSGKRVNRSEPNMSIYREDCYICKDPEFAQLGMPLCRPCSVCGGHVATDDCVCDDCGQSE